MRTGKTDPNKIFNKFFVSNDTVVTDHSDNTQVGSVAWVISKINNKAELVITSSSDDYMFLNNYTIPSNISLTVENGDGNINITSGKILTINGTFSCGLYQVFSGSGSVIFGQGSVKDVYPQWWGSGDIFGGWNYPLVFGDSYLWISITSPNSGKLMVKNGSLPTSDMDGSVIGSGGTGSTNYVEALNKTDNYIVEKNDFGKSIRMDSTAETTVNLPAMLNTDEGAKITVVKLNSGKVNIVCDTLDQIADSVSNTVYNDSIDELCSFLNLEYVYTKRVWLISGQGSWTTL